MALNQNQKTKILFYAGWSGLTIVPESTHFNSVVNDRIEDASSIDAICKIVKDLLEKLEGLDEKLEKARCRLAAKQVDNITMNEDEIRYLLKERRRCIRELLDLIDVPSVRSSGVTVGVVR